MKSREDKKLILNKLANEVKALVIATVPPAEMCSADEDERIYNFAIINSALTRVLATMIVTFGIRDAVERKKTDVVKHLDAVLNLSANELELQVRDEIERFIEFHDDKNTPSNA